MATEAETKVENIYLVMEEKTGWKTADKFEYQYYMREFQGEESFRKAIASLCSEPENEYEDIEYLIRRVQDREFGGVTWHSIYIVNDVKKRFLGKKQAKVVVHGDCDY